MFKNSLDNKEIITKPNGDQIVDLTASIFKDKKKASSSIQIKKVSEEMAMRIDLCSIAAFGDDDYAEHLLKFSDISNPFALAEDDKLFYPNMINMNDDIATNTVTTTTDDALIRRYHTYVDTAKLPVNETSDKSKVTIVASTPTEANIAEEGTSAIEIKNGKVYFGNTHIECANSGMTLGDYLASVNKNS